MGRNAVVKASAGTGMTAYSGGSGEASPVEGFLAGQLSPETRRAYRLDLESFLRFLNMPEGLSGHAVIATLRGVTREQAIAFRDTLIAQGKAPATVSRRVGVIANIYEVLREEGLIEKSPFFRVKRPKVSREGTTPALTKQQAEWLLTVPNRNTAVGHRDLVLLGLLLYCGLPRHVNRLPPAHLLNDVLHEDPQDNRASVRVQATP